MISFLSSDSSKREKLFQTKQLQNQTVLSSEQVWLVTNQLEGGDKKIRQLLSVSDITTQSNVKRTTLKNLEDSKT